MILLLPSSSSFSLLCVGNISSSSPAAPLSDFPQTCPCVVIDRPFLGVSARSLAEFVKLLSRKPPTDVFVLLAHTLNITSHNGTRKTAAVWTRVCVNSGSHANAHTTTHITRKRWPTYLFSVGLSSKSRSDSFRPALGITYICRALLFRESESPSVISLCERKWRRFFFVLFFSQARSRHFEIPGALRFM